LIARIKEIAGANLSSISAIIIALFLDQFTKFLVISFLGSKPVSLLGGVLRFQMTLNTRGIFGLSFGSDHLYFLLPVIGIVVLAYLFFIAKNRIESVVVGLIIGGALGNLIDRLRLNAVVDFIDMGVGNIRWPTYNLADAFITIGIIVLLLYGIGHKKDS